MQLEISGMDENRTILTGLLELYHLSRGLLIRSLGWLNRLARTTDKALSDK